MLFYPAALPLSSRTLTYVAGVIRRHRQNIGSCWHKLSPGRQTPLVLAHPARRPVRSGPVNTCVSEREILSHPVNYPV